MKKLKILLNVWLMLPLAIYAQSGIHFEQGLSWQQIQAKAKKEHKYIFLDCYATWCGPCKQMDQQVYPDTALGKFLNPLFVSVKVQMDSIAKDNEYSRSWYADAHQLMTAYKVGAFPTFLFFSSNGKLVHRGLGVYSTEDFLQLALAANDPSKQEYALLDKFRKGTLPDAEVPNLIKALEHAQDDEAEKEVAEKYIHEYLLKLPDELLYKRENIAIMDAFLESSKDQVFELFYKHGDLIDKGFGESLADATICNIITHEDIYPKLWHNSKLKEPILTKPDWAAISRVIEKKI